jgi:predicted enzyme involved in methoxymalonyl-ACP biosynthesis
VIGLQLRLLDRFGDNGMIAVVIARQDGAVAEIDTWLMSCRVLGRKAEEATLALLAAQARRQGVEKLIGRYVPSAKNGMVAGHYEKLGFTPLGGPDADGAQAYGLVLSSYEPPVLPMVTEQAGGAPAELMGA